MLALLIWGLNEKQQKGIEFTEFNSQYVGKDSTRSNNEFPNFDVDIMKEPTTESEIGSEKSVEREKRRRKRKASRLQEGR